MSRARVSAAWNAQRELLRTRAGRAMALAVLALGLATIVALVVLWPPGASEYRRANGLIVASAEVIAATFTGVQLGNCPLEATPGCQRVDIRLDGGSRPGHHSYLNLPGDEAAPRLSVGDHIRVAPNAESFGNVPADRLADADPAQVPFSFVDYQRGRPLLLLFAVFALLTVVLGRFTGAVALLGAAAGLALVCAFIAPAILHGRSPFLVALVGAFAAMFLAIVPLYGIGAKSLAALAGTAVSLAVIALAAVVFVHATHITGTASEDATLIKGLGGGRVSLQGLVIAGILIGALGVLNDVTVSQSSTVLALRKTDPRLSGRELYRAAIGVGRDHLGATVNTLVFAYAGSALPLLLVFSSQDISLADAFNRETVAGEIVAALVGSLGLICAVPLSTLAAVALASRVPVASLPDGHGHSHTH